MGRKSSIASLPREVLERLNFMISEGALTLDDLTAWLEKQGHERSRSAIGRHARKVEKLGARLRQSRELVQGLGREIGEIPEGKAGRLLVEGLRTFVFDLLEKLDDENAKQLSPQDFHFIARTLKDLASAARLDQDFEEKIRQRVKMEEREHAAAAAETAATDAGLSAEAIREIRAKVMMGA